MHIVLVRTSATNVSIGPRYLPTPACSTVYTCSVDVVCSVEHDFSFTDDAALLFDCIIRAFDPRFSPTTLAL